MGNFISDCRFYLLLILVMGGSCLQAPAAVAGDDDGTVDSTSVNLDDPSSPQEKETIGEMSGDFKSTLAREGYHFTPAVLEAYIQNQKAIVRTRLKADGKTIPDKFLAWVDNDPVVRSTVYGSPNPAHVLLMLYSLSLDLGQPRFERYKNLMLAAAIKHAHEGPKANLSLRQPLKLVIPSDPRKPVNTKDPNRKLDPNDHIINFLADNKLVASDVMYNADWQKKFNAYMEEKGQPARVNCSMKLGVGSLRDKRPGIRAIMDAYRLFQTAYEEKGLIPRQREPRVGLAEWLVFLTQNHANHTAKADFPLDKAPWPVLTAILDPHLSLREAYWINKKNAHIIGDRYKLNAATTEELKAVDVRPFPFAEESWFNVKKHGGACGTRAWLAFNQNMAEGQPSLAIGEINHASWMEIRYFKNGGKYKMKYSGGGHNPFTLTIHRGLPISRGRDKEKASTWEAFLDAIQGKGGVQSYMESMMVYYTIQSLGKDEQTKYGAQLKADALKINPGNLLLSGIIERNTAKSQQDMKMERWRKKHAGELLRAQRGKGEAPKPPPGLQ